MGSQSRGFNGALAYYNNPACAFSDTFAGVRLGDVPLFIGRNSLERFARSLQHKPLSANTAPSRPKQNEHDQ
jgi:hypothetical protein